MHSRVGRRLLVLFVVCSLLPSTAIALLSFVSVTRQLRRASIERLDHTADLLGQAVANRLTLLDQDLAVVPGRDAPCPALATASDGPACDEALLYGLAALSFVPATGSPVLLFGPAYDHPVLSGPERRILAGGGVVVTRPAEGRPHLFLVRGAAPGGGEGVLVGLLNPAYLTASQERTPLLPTMRFDLVDSTGQVVLGSDWHVARVPEVALTRLSSGRSGTFEWEVDDVPHLASHRPMPEGGRPTLPRWTMVVSESRAHVVSPLGDFRRTFPLILGLGLGAALLLSFQQLRRSLVPLEALRQGTRRLARQQFDEPVVVHSRDEFAEVAASFNIMTDQIRRQFTALSTGAEFDRAVLSSVDTVRIVETVLRRLRDVCECEWVGVSLIPDASRAEITTWVSDPEASNGMASWNGRITPAERRRLATAPEGMLHPDTRLPDYLTPLTQRGARGLWSLPLLYQEQLLGAITVGGFLAQARPEEEILGARRVVGPIALALVNAQMVDQMRHLAFRDSLTGLPNRHAFKETLAEELARPRENGRMVALCFLDLDHFSRINDTLGHTVGDRLVRDVGARVRACCLAQARGATVARLGGDEFTVILPDVPDLDEAARVAQRILEACQAPFMLDGHEVFVTTSIGIAMHPLDGLDMETLLRNADAAVYQAKKNGRNRFQAYTASMTASTARRLTLENHLRRALESDQFVLWYQPVVNLATGRIVSAEALVRWQHPDWGLVEPAEFIRPCEETGLIVPLGEWILRTLCEQNRAWQAQGLRAIPVASNVSGKQLASGGVVETIRDLLRRTELSPRHLTIELTESILMADTGDTAAAVHALAELGVGLAIDDFGTGYSSLSYLKHFPVDTVKIDRSFIRDLGTSADDTALASAIIAIGRALNLKVVAEGVETADQLALLRELGCDAIQGYLVARPMPAEAFGRYLRDTRRALELPARSSPARRRRRTG
jgi:diguanylate cyclase (GGDEF)-like protein